MITERHLSLFALVLLAVAVWIGGSVRIPEKTSKPNRQPANPSAESVASNSGETNPRLREASPGDAASSPDLVLEEKSRPFVKRVLAEVWVDGPEKIAGRKRIRIVDADFKYPLLRIEEKVTINPETGGEEVREIVSSVADHLIVGLNDKASSEAARNALTGDGYKIRMEEPGSYLLIEIENPLEAGAQEKLVEKLAAYDDFIDFAEPDHIVRTTSDPNDPDYLANRQWGLNNPGTVAGSTPDADIDAPEAWAIRSGAPDVVVAVTDTGIRHDHEDLAANMWTDGLGNHGYDFYEEDDDPMDTTGHGTHVAGIIGARGDNGKGITGVAQTVKLMAVRFLGPDGGTTSDAIRAVNYARANGAHIINASWGGNGRSQGLASAISECFEEEIFFVAAAGNDNRNTDADPHFPSSFNTPNVISVAAFDKKNLLASFSNYGTITIDVAAPGGAILSCGIASISDYTYLSGTSMAAPHVAGALAVAIAHFPTEKVEDLVTRLITSSEELAPDATSLYDIRRMNFHKLLVQSTSATFHDDFDAPYRLEGCLSHWCGRSHRATREADENLFSPDTGQHSYWFSYLAPEDGFMSFTGQAQRGDVSVVAFQGTHRNSLKRIADNFAERPTKQSTLHFYVEKGQEYRFSLDTRHPQDQLLIASHLFRPLNDMFAQAVRLPGGGNFSTTGINCGATRETFESGMQHARYGLGNSVWWKMTAEFDGEMTVTTQGSHFDTVLAAFTGDTPENLQQIVFNDDRNRLDKSSEIRFTATAGTTYHFVVDSYSDSRKGLILLNGFVDGFFKILSQPESVDAKLGTLAVFSTNVLSAGPVRYQWFKDGTAIHGATESSLVIIQVRANQFGLYHVEVSNGVETLVSEPAPLSEVQDRPVIRWNSGNQSAPNGGSASFSVIARGSPPFIYRWYKNGKLIPGADSATLFLEPVNFDSAGTYTIEIGNQRGNTSLDMTLTIVSTPWDGFEWRSPGVVNQAVTDIKAYDTEAYAVSGDTLHHSTDGIHWTKTKLPHGFYGKAFGKLGDLRIIVGVSAFANIPQVAISTNGGPWQVQALESQVFVQGFKFTLAEFKGVLTGNVPSYSADPGLKYSSDGITWDPSLAFDEGGLATTFFHSGVPATDGNTMIVASSSDPGNGQVRYFKSTDGIHWTRHVTQAPGATGSGTAAQAVYSQGKFHLFSTHKIFTSTDATNWTVDVALSNGFTSTAIPVGSPDRTFGFSVPPGNSRAISFASPASVESKSVAGSHAFNSAAWFNGRILYGTQTGYILSAAEFHDIVFPDVSLPGKPVDVKFLNGMFRVTYFASDQSLVSGDGRDWRLIQGSQFQHNRYIGYASGKHWGRFSPAGGGVVTPTNNPIVTGLSPLNLTNPRANVDGLDSILTFIMESPAGDVLASTSQAPLTGQSFARPAGQTVWTSLGNGQFVDGNVKFLAGRWYSIEDNSLRSSTDGINWQQTGTTNKYEGITERDGILYAIRHPNSAGGFGIETSPDGITWTPSSIVGMPTSGILTNLLEFNGSLVAHRGGVYLSDDGITWARASLPANVVSIAKGVGRFVAVTSDGAVLETGSSHPGGFAPFIGFDAPGTNSIHTLGSQITVAGSIHDIEDTSASFKILVDGQIAATGTGTRFEHRFDALSTAGHHIEVIATDSHGLMNADSIRIKATVAEAPNLLAEGTGATYVSPGQIAELNGSFYLLGKQMLLRSRDGITWQRVEIPYSGGKLSAMVSGNGALILQYSNGIVVSTRDGVNWTGREFTPISSQRLQFQAGLFIYANHYSEDGEFWVKANLTHDNGWLAIGSDTMLVRSYQDPPAFSNNFGKSWRPITGLASSQLQAGIFWNGRFVGIDSTNGKAWVSLDGLVWDDTDYPFFSSVGNIPILFSAGATLFLGNQFHYKLSSTDGVNWQPLSHPINVNSLRQAMGAYQGIHQGRIALSSNAIDWQILDGENDPSGLVNLMDNGTTLLAVSSNGATSVSTNGDDWTPILPGSLDIAHDPLAFPRKLVRFNDMVLLGGTRGLLKYSEDDAISWIQASRDDTPVPGNETFAVMEANSHAVLALTSGSLRKLYRTTDGRNWSFVPDSQLLGFHLLATDGTHWLAGNAFGVLMKSTDHGQTWATAATGLSRIAAIHRLGPNWVILGSTTESTIDPLDSYTLTDAGVLTKAAAAVLPSSSPAPQTLVAHGRMLVWRTGLTVRSSADGIQWHDSGFVPPFSAAYRVTPSPSGFVATSGKDLSTNTWTSPPDAQTWTAGSSPYNRRLPDTVFENRAFLFRQGSLEEIHSQDLALRLDSDAPLIVGVGDVIEPQVTIRNLGQNPFPEGEWIVRAHLSKDPYFGDANDTLLGNSQINAPMPAPGVELPLTLAFEIPEQLLTGENYLILTLQNLSGFNESNVANNISISEQAIITIPEWELALDTNGNGTINQDIAALRFAHKARVSLTANSGKGTSFAGWGGDGIGAESQITILMNGDKQVVANFSDRANLQLIITGMGTVTGLEDFGSYPLNHTASLTAIPASGWEFAGWSGDATESAVDISIPMDSPKTLTARFSLSYPSWKTLHFSEEDLTDPLVSGDDADSNRNGIPNRLEYIHGSAPKDSGSPVRTSMDGGFLRMIYTRNTGLPDGYSLTALATREMTDWNLPDLQQRVIESANGIETVEARIPTNGHQKGFLRLRYTEPSSPVD